MNQQNQPEDLGKLRFPVDVPHFQSKHSEMMDCTLPPVEAPRPTSLHQRQTRCLRADAGLLLSLQEKLWPFVSTTAAWQHRLVGICWLHCILNIFPCQVEQIIDVDLGEYLTSSNAVSTVKSSNPAFKSRIMKLLIKHEICESVMTSSSCCY